MKGRVMANDRPVAELDRMRSDIAGEMLRVHEENYGTGATNIDVHFAEDIVLVILEVELTVAERTLVTAGQTQAVKTTRESFQTVIGPTFTAIVEHATGRRVSSFLSSMSVDPLYSAELFRLYAPN